jgi:translation initiation factor 2B subunit (eIF-2B alpha/beta/delta family)
MGRVNKLFLGAISVTNDRKVITTAGSANIASLCRHHRIPIYLFTCSLKFTHQVSEEQHIPNKQHKVSHNGVSYPVTSFSHDIVDLTLIDHVITEKNGLVRPAMEP